MKRISVVLFAFYVAVMHMPHYAEAQSPETFRQEGIASWYGPEFDGRPTASGEIFNSSLLTAAHPALPFGTMLKVTNRHNGKQVMVRVNDRGPFVSARIIDVSKAAAEQLDMIVTGTTPVLIESVGMAASGQARTAPQTAPDSYWTLPPASVAAVPVVPAPAAPPVQPYNQQMPPQVQAPAPVYSQPPAVTAYPQRPAQPIVIYAAPVPPVPAPAAPVPVTPAAPVTPAPAAPVPPVPALAAPVPPVPAPVTPVPAAPATVAAPTVEPLPVSRAVAAPVVNNTLPNKVYRIQVGAYKIPKNAVEAFERLKNAGLNPAYERGGEYFRVVLAGVPGTEVQSVTEKLGQAGFGEALVREER